MQHLDVLLHRQSGRAVPGPAEFVNERVHVGVGVPHDARDHVGIDVLEMLPASQPADVDTAQADLPVVADVLDKRVEGRIGKSRIVIGGRVVERHDALGPQRMDARPVFEVLADVLLQVDGRRPRSPLALDDGAEDDEQVRLGLDLERGRARAVIGEDGDELAGVFLRDLFGDLIVEPDHGVSEAALFGVERPALLALAELHHVAVVDRIVVLVGVGGDPVEHGRRHGLEQIGIRQAVLLHGGADGLALSADQGEPVGMFLLQRFGRKQVPHRVMPEAALGVGHHLGNRRLTDGGLPLARRQPALHRRDRAPHGPPLERRLVLEREGAGYFHWEDRRHCLQFAGVKPAAQLFQEAVHRIDGPARVLAGGDHVAACRAQDVPVVTQRLQLVVLDQFGLQETGPPRRRSRADVNDALVGGPLSAAFDQRQSASGDPCHILAQLLRRRLLNGVCLAVHEDAFHRRSVAPVADQRRRRRGRAEARARSGLCGLAGRDGARRDPRLHQHLSLSRRPRIEQPEIFLRRRVFPRTHVVEGRCGALQALYPHRRVLPHDLQAEQAGHDVLGSRPCLPRHFRRDRLPFRRAQQAHRSVSAAGELVGRKHRQHTLAGTGRDVLRNAQLHRDQNPFLVHLEFLRYLPLDLRGRVGHGDTPLREGDDGRLARGIIASQVQKPLPFRLLDGQMAGADDGRALEPGLQAVLGQRNLVRPLRDARGFGETRRYQEKRQKRGQEGKAVSHGCFLSIRETRPK